MVSLNDEFASQKVLSPLFDCPFDRIKFLFTSVPSLLGGREGLAGILKWTQTVLVIFLHEDSANVEVAANDKSVEQTVGCDACKSRPFQGTSRQQTGN